MALQSEFTPEEALRKADALDKARLALAEALRAAGNRTGRGVGAFFRALFADPAEAVVAARGDYERLLRQARGWAEDYVEFRGRDRLPDLAPDRAAAARALRGELAAAKRAEETADDVLVYLDAAKRDLSLVYGYLREATRERAETACGVNLSVPDLGGRRAPEAGVTPAWLREQVDMIAHAVANVGRRDARGMLADREAASHLDRATMTLREAMRFDLLATIPVNDLVRVKAAASAAADGLASTLPKLRAELPLIAARTAECEVAYAHAMAPARAAVARTLPDPLRVLVEAPFVVPVPSQEAAPAAPAMQ